MFRCDKCQSSAIIYQKYSGKRLCQAHFDEDVFRKVRESLRQTGLFGRGARVALDLDGGIGSAVLAFVLKDIFRSRRDINFVAMVIDEREARAEPARLIAERLEIPAVEKRLPSLPMPEEACPTFDARAERRGKFLMALAQENGAGVLATGHNLDDEATDVFMSYLRGELDGLLAPGQSVIEKEGKISWIKPLRRVPEKEIRLFAIKHGLGRSDIVLEDRFRIEAKRLLCEFDSRHPGTKYSLLRSQEKLSRHNSGGAAGQSL
jgi:tRNA(Ile)-lysidine synthase TilS/MesJ